ncbi:MAG: hypothetical protein IT291_04395, partial [Deltaproteobacteria bacterium]|nr:hypothetical protein [Deltaproteobacteria bacterium]
MSGAKQNSSIARLVVGAMTIDGSLSRKERDKVAKTLETIGMGELVAYVGIAIDEDDGHFNMFQECETLIGLLGPYCEELAPVIFRIVCDVVANDRFVSQREAAYLSAMAKRLKISATVARDIFKETMAQHRSRLEVAGSGVDKDINPYLKELLSFQGSEGLVGGLDANSLEAMMDEATEAMQEGVKVSRDDMTRALTVLGLQGTAGLDDAKTVWKETIDNLNLPKMANLGETFVSAAIARIARIN